MKILKIWEALSRFGPLGRWIFGTFVKRLSPYSSSIHPSVERLEKGVAVVSLCQRRKLGNPFQSIHAIALANLGELASGFAFLTTIPPGKRGIVTKFEIEYFKKARGKITAHSNTAFPDREGAFEVRCDLLDEGGVLVARTLATWTIGSAKNG